MECTCKETDNPPYQGAGPRGQDPGADDPSLGSAGLGTTHLFDWIQDLASTSDQIILQARFRIRVFLMSDKAKLDSAVEEERFARLLRYSRSFGNRFQVRSVVEERCSIHAGRT